MSTDRIPGPESTSSQIFLSFICRAAMADTTLFADLGKSVARAKFELDELDMLAPRKTREHSGYKNWDHQIIRTMRDEHGAVQKDRLIGWIDYHYQRMCSQPNRTEEAATTAASPSNPPQQENQPPWHRFPIGSPEWIRENLIYIRDVQINGKINLNEFPIFEPTSILRVPSGEYEGSTLCVFLTRDHLVNGQPFNDAAELNGSDYIGQDPKVNIPYLCKDALGNNLFIPCPIINGNAKLWAAWLTQGAAIKIWRVDKVKKKQTGYGNTSPAKWYTNRNGIIVPADRY